MKTVKLQILDINIYPDGNGVVVTKQTADNPSDSGVFRQSAAQLNRLAIRAGVPNAIALKHLVGLPGNNLLEMGVEDCKAGDPFEMPDGSTGTYEKDWLRTVNEKVVLGVVAQTKLVEVSLQFGMQAMMAGYAAPAQPTPQASDSNDGDEGGEEPATTSKATTKGGKK